MPAPTRHKPPDEQLRILARFAKAQGLSFDDFWERAVRPEKPPVRVTTPAHRRPAGAVLWPHDHRDREAARTGVLASKDSWRRMYEGGANLTRPEAALASLVAA